VRGAAWALIGDLAVPWRSTRRSAHQVCTIQGPPASRQLGNRETRTGRNCRCSRSVAIPVRPRWPACLVSETTSRDRRPEGVRVYVLAAVGAIATTCVDSRCTSRRLKIGKLPKHSIPAKPAPQCRQLRFEGGEVALAGSRRLAGGLEDRLTPGVA
jgi:hypothetical protein